MTGVQTCALPICIFVRGGIYLYPGDRRKGYRDGRLRLIYEANPIAWLVEQAGGAASTGRDRVLDLEPKRLHERKPIIIGARDEVAYVEQLTRQPEAMSDRSPLFTQRGLFRV